MIVDESEVAIKKFKMFADKATSESEIVTLCKKYLKHKGIDLDHKIIPQPPKIERIVVNKGNIEFLKHQITSDSYHMKQLSNDMKMQVQSQMYKEMATSLAYQMLNKDLIHIETHENFVMAQTIYSASVGIWRDK